MRACAALLLLAGAAVAQFYDHVVITSAELAPSFAPLCSVVETRLGYYDTLVLVDDIFRTQPGRDAPEKIRNFIRRAYDEWVTSYVLLGGDIEVVPCRYAYVDIGSARDDIPCDLYYAALDGDWDADHDNVFGEPEDSADLYPEVRLGRLPVSTPAEAAKCVAKFGTYVGSPEAEYLRNVFLNGFDIYSWCIGEQAMEYYDTSYVAESMRPCVKVYDSDGGSHRDSTLHYLNRGQHIWVHADHSNWNAMGVGWNNHREVITTSDLTGLGNAPDHSIMLSVGCDVSCFDSSDCIAERFICAQNGGGVAAFGNSRLGLLDATKPIHGASFMQVEEMVRAWFSHPQRAALGDMAETQAQVAPLAAVSERYRWCHYQFTLFGDPVMPVWIPGQSGTEDRIAGREPVSARRMPSVARGILVMPPPGSGISRSGLLLDAAGRRVVALQPGTNDVSQLAPGVYFVRAGRASGKVIIGN